MNHEYERSIDVSRVELATEMEQFMYVLQVFLVTASTAAQPPGSGQGERERERS